MFTNSQTKKSKVPNAGFPKLNARFGRKKGDPVTTVTYQAIA